MLSLIGNFLMWLLSLFTGKSAQEKLGQAETTNKSQAEIIKEVQKSEQIDQDNSLLSADGLRQRVSKYQRPD
jgi:hypothetical protein